MVTVSGSGQVNLVKLLSKKTHELGGKWLNSKINHIDEYFSGLLKIEIDAEQVEKLIINFRKSMIKVDFVALNAEEHKKLTHLDLNIDAQDRPGLVHAISEVLSENGVKVENMECHRLGVADISGTVFTSHFKIAVEDDDFNKQVLIDELQEIAADLVIDLHIKD